MRVVNSKHRQKIAYLLLIFIFIYCWIALATRVKKQQENVPVRANSRQIREVSMEQGQDFTEKMEENLRRQQRIREFCMKEDTKIKVSTLVKTNHTIRTYTDPNYSFIYCRVNKAASTFTMKSLELLFNCSADSMRFAAARLYKLPPEQVRDITDRAYKFMLVREPYGRLYSAYSNKFYFPKGNWAPVGPEIVKRYRQNPSADSLKYGYDVTFAELIRYLVDEFEDGYEADLDAHIRPMHVRCNPCDYEYNFIGKLETLNSDWEYLVHEFESRHLLKIGEETTRKVTVRMTKIRRGLARINGSNIPLYNIYQRAWGYFQIIGVISKHIPMPFPNDNNTISYDAFIEAHELATNQSTIYATEVKGQKREAMLQAFSSVPLEYLERFRKMVMKDCLLYGYDDRPSLVFDRETGIKDIKPFQYFKGLD